MCFADLPEEGTGMIRNLLKNLESSYDLEILDCTTTLLPSAQQRLIMHNLYVGGQFSFIVVDPQMMLFQHAPYHELEVIPQNPYKWSYKLH